MWGTQSALRRRLRSPFLLSAGSPLRRSDPWRCRPPAFRRARSRSSSRTSRDPQTSRGGTAPTSRRVHASTGACCARPSGVTRATRSTRRATPSSSSSSVRAMPSPPPSRRSALSRGRRTPSASGSVSIQREPYLDEEGYVGVGVHRAARICAAGRTADRSCSRTRPPGSSRISHRGREVAGSR